MKVSRALRHAVVLAITGSLAVAVLASAQAPQPIDRVLTVGVLEVGCEAIGQKDPCWDTSTLTAQPGDKIKLRADLRWSDNLHNIHVTKGVEGSPKTALAPKALHELDFVMPASGSVTFICDAHPTMSAIVGPPSAGGGGHGLDVPHLGVNFLAYWVGLIAFALLFIVYGLTFFLFKYNETPATTDQWDRSGEAPAGTRRFGAGATSLLALVLAAVVIGAVVYLARQA